MYCAHLWQVKQSWFVLFLESLIVLIFQVSLKNGYWISTLSIFNTMMYFGKETFAYKHHSFNIFSQHLLRVIEGIKEPLLYIM